MSELEENYRYDGLVSHEGAKRVRKISLPFLILILTAIVPSTLIAGQNRISRVDTSVASKLAIGNSGTSSITDSSRESQPRKVKILVTPDSAAGASITIVRKSEIQTSPSSMTILAIPPDTIGTWRAPLSMVLFQGDYKFIATRPGFRQAEASARLAFEPSDSISIDMLSLDYLRRMRERWGEYKWISAGVAAGAGIAAWFSYERIGTAENKYNSAVALSAIQAGRNSVKTNQALYTISSTVAIAAVGSFLFSWIMQALNHK